MLFQTCWVHVPNKTWNKDVLSCSLAKKGNEIYDKKSVMLVRSCFLLIEGSAYMGKRCPRQAGHYPSWVKFSESLWERRWFPCLRLCYRAIGADLNLSSLLHVSNVLATVRNKTYRWFSDGLLYFIQKFQLLFSIFNHSFQQLTFDDTWQRKQRKAYSYKNKWPSEFVKVKLP